MILWILITTSCKSQYTGPSRLSGVMVQSRRYSRRDFLRYETVWQLNESYGLSLP